MPTIGSLVAVFLLTVIAVLLFFIYTEMIEIRKLMEKAGGG